MRSIAELGFSKFDVAIHEEGGQMRPSEVAEDVNAAALRLRMGPGLIPSAFSVSLEAGDEDEGERDAENETEKETEGSERHGGRVIGLRETDGSSLYGTGDVRTVGLGTAPCNPAAKSTVGAVAGIRRGGWRTPADRPC